MKAYAVELGKAEFDRLNAIGESLLFCVSPSDMGTPLLLRETFG